MMETAKNSEPISQEPSSHEASLNMARSLLSEGATVESIMAKTTLSKPAILGLKGALVKASKRLNARSKPTEATSKPQIKIQAETKPEEDSAQEPMSQPGSIELLEEDRASIRKLVPQKAHGPLEAVYEIAARRQRQINRNNGHGSQYFSYGHEENPYLKRIEMMAEARDLKEVLGLGKNDHEDSELSRRLDRIETKLDNAKQGSELLQFAKAVNEFAQPKGPGVNPLEYVNTYRAGAQDARQNIQTANQKTEIDLKSQEMAATERLDNKKLDWEMQKHQDEKDSQAQLYGIVGSVVKGPVSDLIGVFGNAAAERLKGKQQPPIEPIQISCPSCKKPFWTDPRLEVITCGHCGARLQKLGTQGPQPQEQPQKEQPSETETQEEKSLSPEKSETQPSEKEVS